jgi:hypothetical protein
VEDHVDEKDDRGESNEGGNRFHAYNFPIRSIRLSICRLTRTMLVPTNITPPVARLKVSRVAVSEFETNQPVNVAKIAIAAASQSL